MKEDAASASGADLAGRLIRAMGEVMRLRALDFNDVARQALAIGCRELDISGGAIARVQDGVHQIKHIFATGNADAATGGPTPLKHTWCAQTLTTDQTVGFHVATGTSREGLTAYRPGAPQAYIGAPIRVEGAVFGTVSFSQPNVRSRPVDRHELEFVGMLGQWIGEQITIGRIQTRLEESDLRFRRAFDNAAVCKALVSLDGKFLQVNRALCDMLGYTKLDLLHKTIADVAHPDDLNLTLDMMSKCRNSKTPVTHFQKSYIHKTGRVVRAMVYVAVIHDQGNRPKYAVVEMADITRQWDADEERRRIFDLSVDVIVVMDIHGRIMQTNPAITRVLGYTAEEITGLSITRLTHPDDRPAVQAQTSRLLRGNKAVAYEHRMIAKDGSSRWLSWNASILPEKELMFGVARDITDAKAAERKLRHAAMHDLLTGLPNRTLLGDRLHQAIRRARREADYQYAVLFLDLNGFKQINDTHGHTVGDHLLVDVAKRLRESLRDLDTAAYAPVGDQNDDLPVRLGGDEFVILLEGIQSYDDASLVSQRLSERIAEPYQIQNLTLTLTASIGIATSERAYESPAEVIAAADKAMYQNKRQGRDDMHRR